MTSAWSNKQNLSLLLGAVAGGVLLAWVYVFVVAYAALFIFLRRLQVSRTLGVFSEWHCVCAPASPSHCSPTRRNPTEARYASCRDFRYGSNRPVSLFRCGVAARCKIVVGHCYRRATARPYFSCGCLAW